MIKNYNRITEEVNQNIIDKKPEIKLKSNHFKYTVRPNRVWLSKLWGTAVRNGVGWYVRRDIVE